MHQNILTPEQTKLLPLISQFGRDFYLVGGTALALQYGHRQSIDFDLFTPSEFDNARIRKVILRQHKINTVHIESVGEYTLVVDGIKMTFYQYEFPVEHQIVLDEVISMPDDLTIAAMKAFAIGNRNKWKDYVDLYYLLQRHSLAEIVEKAEGLFGIGLFNEKLFREQLAYHDDIDYRERVEWMPGFAVPDEEIKAYLLDVATS